MKSLVEVLCLNQHPLLSRYHHRSSFFKPLISLSFQSSSSSLKYPSIKASSRSPPSSSAPFHGASHNPKHSLLKTISIAIIAGAALLFWRLRHKPVFAAVVAKPTVEPANESSDNLSYEEQERAIEDHLRQHSDDTKALRSLVELRIKSQKLLQAVEVVNRLIKLEPDQNEWPLLKAQIYCYNGDLESARRGFEELLAKDPLRVEAYHGLVLVNAESGEAMGDLLKRIEAASLKCKKENKKWDVRDFKLLLAQVKVVEGNYVGALEIYDELVKEEPRDFRPYLCRGIIYNLLGKSDMAEKQVEIFKKLVPKDHPYREFFIDKMFATKFFSENVETGSADSKS